MGQGSRKRSVLRIRFWERKSTTDQLRLLRFIESETSEVYADDTVRALRVSLSHLFVSFSG